MTPAGKSYSGSIWTCIIVTIIFKFTILPLFVKPIPYLHQYWHWWYGVIFIILFWSVAFRLEGRLSFKTFLVLPIYLSRNKWVGIWTIKGMKPVEFMVKDFILLNGMTYLPEDTKQQAETKLLEVITPIYNQYSPVYVTAYVKKLKWYKRLRVR